MIFNIGRFIFIPWLLQCMHFILRITVFVIQFASLGSSQLASTIHSIISVWQCVSTEKWFWRSKIHPPPSPPVWGGCEAPLKWIPSCFVLCVYIHCLVNSCTERQSFTKANGFSFSLTQDNLRVGELLGIISIWIMACGLIKSSVVGQALIFYFKLSVFLQFNLMILRIE